VTDLAPYTAALSHAIARRQDLDALARSGWGIPAQITHQTEASIREAEQALLAAAQSNTEQW
jgi:hypothetical protein